MNSAIPCVQNFMATRIFIDVCANVLLILQFSVHRSMPQNCYYVQGNDLRLLHTQYNVTIIAE